MSNPRAIQEAIDIRLTLELIKTVKGQFEIHKKILELGIEADGIKYEFGEHLVYCLNELKHIESRFKTEPIELSEAQRKIYVSVIILLSLFEDFNFLRLDAKSLPNPYSKLISIRLKFCEESFDLMHCLHAPHESSLRLRLELPALLQSCRKLKKLASLLSGDTSVEFKLSARLIDFIQFISAKGRGLHHEYFSQEEFVDGIMAWIEQIQIFVFHKLQKAEGKLSLDPKVNKESAEEKPGDDVTPKAKWHPNFSYASSSASSSAPKQNSAQNKLSVKQVS